MAGLLDRHREEHGREAGEDADDDRQDEEQLVLAQPQLLRARRRRWSSGFRRVPAADEGQRLVERRRWAARGATCLARGDRSGRRPLRPCPVHSCRGRRRCLEARRLALERSQVTGVACRLLDARAKALVDIGDVSRQAAPTLGEPRRVASGSRDSTRSTTSRVRSARRVGGRPSERACARARSCRAGTPPGPRRRAPRGCPGSRRRAR